jgi:hypothetical protein
MVNAVELARWLQDRSHGEPADALAALAVVTAALLNCSPTPQRTRDKYVELLTRAMTIPNVLFEPELNA